MKFKPLIVLIIIIIAHVGILFAVNSMGQKETASSKEVDNPSNLLDSSNNPSFPQDNIPLPNIHGDNNEDKPLDNNILVQEPSRTEFHTVAKNESLSAIANKYKCSVKDLQSLNNITDPNRIRIGQKIKIPK